MSKLGFLGQFLSKNKGSLTGSAVSEGAAFAAGVAIGPTLRPAVQAIENDAWSTFPNRPLSSETVARAMHRGLIDDKGLLPVPPPSGHGKIKRFPVSKLNGVDESKSTGVDEDRLKVELGIVGLPMGPIEAAHAYFRGDIELDDFELAIAEGNTRNEWGEPILAYARQIPTAIEYLDNALRGYTTLEEAIKGAAKHGMSAADATLIYQNQGRPMTVHQITMAKARGAKFNPEPGEIKDPYMASIVEGSLKPAYYEFQESLKYSYPGFFQTLQALNKKWIDPQTATNWLLYQGYEPGAVDTIVTNVHKSLGGGTNSWVSRAQGYLFTSIHKGYADTDAGNMYARDGMTLIGIDATAQEQILALFRFETSGK